MEQGVAAGRRPLEMAPTAPGDASGRAGWAKLRVQLLSGMGSGVVSAFALTPFDVVKTRLQVLDSAVGCSHGALSIQGCCVHPATVLTGGSKGIRPGAVQMIGCMVRNEGLPSLWRGTAFSTVAAVPSVGIYMVLYERIKMQLQAGSSGHDRPWAPLVSGAVARSLATLGTSPLELVRIRLMAQHGTRSVGSFALVSAVVRENGWLALWKGIGPSLYRDVPFSAIYWMLAESLRSRFNKWSAPPVLLGGGGGAEGVGGKGMDPQQLQHVLWVNLAAGTLAGGAAAVITHPFDVVKTQVQATMSKHGAKQVGSFTILRRLVDHGGWGALFQGIVPRVLKVAPSCAIVLGSFEVLKTML
ncbi:mitochondrial carrier domain-containing protein [Baffinella frigidus]|nr:mitochondrial carrier domain-containing protein [Cryptophyta sp. CCMP2293]